MPKRVSAPWSTMARTVAAWSGPADSGNCTPPSRSSTEKKLMKLPYMEPQ